MIHVTCTTLEEANEAVDRLKANWHIVRIEHYNDQFIVDYTIKSSKSESGNLAVGKQLLSPDDSNAVVLPLRIERSAENSEDKPILDIEFGGEIPPEDDA